MKSRHSKIEKRNVTLEEVYCLWAVEHKSQRELAAMLGVDKMTVNRALKLFRNTIQPKLPDKDKKDLLAIYWHEYKELKALREKNKDNYRKYLTITQSLLSVLNKISDLVTFNDAKDKKGIYISNIINNNGNGNGKPSQYREEAKRLLHDTFG